MEIETQTTIRAYFKSWIMELKFTKSANPFYNAGIIGFYRNCQDFLDMYGEEYSEFNILPISKNDLILEYSASFERLLSFLEAVY